MTSPATRISLSWNEPGGGIRVICCSKIRLHTYKNDSRYANKHAVPAIKVTEARLYQRYPARDAAKSIREHTRYVLSCSEPSAVAKPDPR